MTNERITVTTINYNDDVETSETVVLKADQIKMLMMLKATPNTKLKEINGVKISQHKNHTEYLHPRADFWVKVENA